MLIDSADEAYVFYQGDAALVSRLDDGHPEPPALVVLDTSLFVFASFGIERTDVATSDATMISVSAAAAVVVDGEIAIARRRQKAQ